MINKTVNFYYKRDSLPHSEYKVIQSLKKFLEDEEKVDYKISTSTASIFSIVRAFCYKYDWDLVAYYEDLDLKMDEVMGTNQWFNCPDFRFEEKALMILLLPKDRLDKPENISFGFE
jgi:hypothetical protein